MDEPPRSTPDLLAAGGLGAATWRGRLARKQLTERVFEGLAAQMKRAGVDAATVDACALIAEEERVHAILCGAVLESLGADAQPPSSREGLSREAASREGASREGISREAISRDGGARESARDVTLSDHGEGAAREAVLCEVLSVAYVAKTISVALLGAERAKLAPGPTREIVSRIYTDEVGQARFAWAYLAREVPALDAPAKARLTAHLARAFAQAERTELAHLPASPHAQREGDARALFYEAAFRVIVPALEGLGIAARAAWEGRDGRRVA